MPKYRTVVTSHEEYQHVAPCSGASMALRGPARPPSCLNFP